MKKIPGSNIQLNIAEQEWLKHMQAMFGCTEIEAIDEIVKYKREQAFMYDQQGNYALAKQILVEIDEWDDTREQDFKNKL